MNVLFASWECDPFFKIGGLGDVSRSLPAALYRKGVEIRNALPYYDVLKLGKNKKTKVATIKVLYNNLPEAVEIYQVIHPTGKFIVYLFKNKKYLNKAKHPDTYALFNKAIVTAIKERAFGEWSPEIVHCNDLHTALIPLLIKIEKLPVKTLLTIHNLTYQGNTTLEILDKLGIKSDNCRVISWEVAAKKINFLLEGIIHADFINTVSPTYAREIMREEQGAGLEEILRGREGKVVGILNGIDIDFNKAWQSKLVTYPYFGRVKQEKKGLSWEEGKKLNKLHLQKKLGLKVGVDIPLLGFIGRFDVLQKGIDLIHKMVRRYDDLQFELAVLGSGTLEWEEKYKWLGKFYPKNISCNFKFDEVLARQIYAGVDFMLIPSSFEPCGLVQMIAMSFGTLPIARKTGGLSDSIKDNENGFLFEKNTSEALEKTIKKAVDIWKNEKTVYRKMVEAALATDFSWDKSAGKYIDLYRKLINNNI